MPSDTGKVGFAEVVAYSLHARRVTYRYYGPNKSLRRQMVHRFEVKGGVTLIEACADNIVKHNSLFRRLCRPGR